MPPPPSLCCFQCLLQISLNLLSCFHLLHVNIILKFIVTLQFIVTQSSQNEYINLKFMKFSLTTLPNVTLCNPMYLIVPYKPSVFLRPIIKSQMQVDRSKIGKSLSPSLSIFLYVKLTFK